MNEFVVDPITGERQKAKQAQPSAAGDQSLAGIAGLSEGEIDARLDAMTVDELKTLVRRSNAVLGGVVLAKPIEVAETIKLRLAHFALTAEIKDALVAIDKYLNRIEGLPVQKETVNMTVSNTVNTFGLPTDVWEAMVLRYGKKLEASRLDKLEVVGGSD